MKVAATYSVNLLFALLIVGLLYIFNFEMVRINPQLLAGIFTLIVSASAVLFTSVMNDSELMIAAKRSGNLIYLFSAFTIPIFISLLGLIMSILGFSFAPPDVPSILETGFSLVLIVISLWASVGFLSSVAILVAIEFGIAGKLESKSDR